MSPGPERSGAAGPAYRPDVQVDADEHYRSAEYLSPRRFFSFGLQLELVREMEPERVLEIGPGPGVVTHALRISGMDVITLDLDPAVRPRLVGDAGRLPLAENSVDVVLCSQVLEHMPFSRAEEALAELRRVARTGAVVSLPDVRPFYFVKLALPKLRGEWRTGVPWRRPAEHSVGGEHYWEIGSAGYPPERFRAAAEDVGWRVARQLRPLEHSFHHFFVLR